MVKELLGEDKDFLWELKSWGESVKLFKENAKDSYASYVLMKKSVSIWIFSLADHTPL